MQMTIFTQTEFKHIRFEYFLKRAFYALSKDYEAFQTQEEEEENRRKCSIVSLRQLHMDLTGRLFSVPHNSL